METETVAVLPLKPDFKALKPQEIADAVGVQFRKVPIPPHRVKPLYRDWKPIYYIVYDEMKVDIRMNTKARRVELKNRPDTPKIGYLQKCADFIHAIVLGFGYKDALGLLRCDEIYVNSFEIKDVKTLRGEHLSRAIGRLSGKFGRTKSAIQNTTETSIVIADTKIHILGPYSRIKIARRCLCDLIRGSPATKVYSKLRQVASRLDSIA
ncbi:hypothetical protein ACS0TY_015766 [Phlomoides rotata]